MHIGGASVWRSLNYNKSQSQSKMHGHPGLKSHMYEDTAENKHGALAHTAFEIKH